MPDSALISRNTSDVQSGDSALAVRSREASLSASAQASRGRGDMTSTSLFSGSEAALIPLNGHTGSSSPDA